jgi:hypothetical protein
VSQVRFAPSHAVWNLLRLYLLRRNNGVLMTYICTSEQIKEVVGGIYRLRATCRTPRSVRLILHTAAPMTVEAKEAIERHGNCEVKEIVGAARIKI